VRLLRLPRTNAPLAVAGLIAVPLYFAALMASSLALDMPQLVGSQELPSTGSTEGKIWLAALIAPGILIAAGLVGMLLRRLGVYLPAAAGIAVCLVMPGLSQPWVARHTARFPIGIDFVKDTDPSNLSTRGEWERTAQETVTSITHWTLGLSIGVVVVALLLEWRRRRGRDAIVVEPPPPASGGTPQITAP
jgi:LPXTG-motif cell wall-anchored protein